MGSKRSAANFNIEGRRLESEEALLSHIKDHGWKEFLYYPQEFDPSTPALRRIKEATIQRSSLSKTIVKGVSFTNCDFIDCLFIGTEFINCEFTDCSFTACNMYKAKASECLIDPEQFKNNFDLRSDSNIAIGWFHALYRNSLATSQPSYARNSLYRMRVAERNQIAREIRKNFSLWKTVLYSQSMLHDAISGYGQKTWRILAAFSLLTSAAVLINFIFRNEIFGQGQVSTFLQALYFTCVTVSTVGFGDVTPKTEIGRLVVSLEALLGPLFFTMALTEVAGRIMRRD
ncbi:ion channel [Stenotrophomonas sp. TWI377]|uniref:ion channel n=1 Tax=Stenotrophomonas sp. TWI377 TaxID=3136775 RepID=UPI0032078F02